MQLDLFGKEPEVAAMPALTNAQHQANHRAKMKAAGMKAVTGWVHPHQASGLKGLIAHLYENPDLEVGPLRNAATGRITGIRVMK